VSTRTPYVCRNFVEDVTDYLEGALPDDTVARIEEHLADCPHCREYLKQLRETIAATHALGDDDIDDMPVDVRQRIMDAFRRSQT
jgi:anti-sigma factor RsiW